MPTVLVDPIEIDQQENQNFPCLLPLRKSHEADNLETELKQIFMDLFNGYLRKKERDLNVSGMAHLGSTEFLSRFIERDGLAVLNDGQNDETVRYIYKAWKGRNPKNGLHLLKTYLQLLYQEKAVITQLWQDKDKPYPTALSDTGSPDKFLTSRVNIKIDSSVLVGYTETVERVLPAIRSILGIQYVLNTFIVDNEIIIGRPIHSEFISVIQG